MKGIYSFHAYLAQAPRLGGKQGFLGVKNCARIRELVPTLVAVSQMLAEVIDSWVRDKGLCRGIASTTSVSTFVFGCKEVPWGQPDGPMWNHR